MQGRLFTEEKEKEYQEWFRRFSISELRRNLEIMERLVYTSEDFCNCLLIDEGISMVELLRDECVRRLFSDLEC